MIDYLSLRYPKAFLDKATATRLAASRHKIPEAAPRPKMLYIDEMHPAEWLHVRRRIEILSDTGLLMFTRNPWKWALNKDYKMYDDTTVIMAEIHRRDKNQFGAVEMYSKHYAATRTCKYMQKLDDLRHPFGVNKFAGFRGYYPFGLPEEFPLAGNPYERVWFWGHWFELTAGVWVDVECNQPFLHMFSHLLS